MKYPQYALGLVTGFCLASLYFMAPAIIDTFKQPEPKTQPITPKGNFSVIDHYNGCDVVQYQYGLLAEYKYFLDCPR